MNQLRIDPDKCTLCGTCEVALPSLLTKAKENVLFVSGTNLKAHAVDIFRALRSCQGQALTLEVVQ